MFAGKIEESRMLGSMYADLADDLECGFFDASTVAATTQIDGIHLDAANTKAVGKALASGRFADARTINFDKNQGGSGLRA